MLKKYHIQFLNCPMCHEKLTCEEFIYWTNSFNFVNDGAFKKVSSGDVIKFSKRYKNDITTNCYYKKAIMYNANYLMDFKEEVCCNKCGYKYNFLTMILNKLIKNNNIENYPQIPKFLCRGRLV